MTLSMDKLNNVLRELGNGVFPLMEITNRLNTEMEPFNIKYGPKTVAKMLRTLGFNASVYRPQNRTHYEITMFEMPTA